MKEPKFVLNVWQTGQERLDPTARSAWELQALVVIVKVDHLHLANRQLQSMLHPVYPHLLRGGRYQPRTHNLWEHLSLVS